MTETDDKPEEKKPVKKGIHGWKAALAMFGCGSLAAFSVFGVISAVLGSFLSVLSVGPGEDGSDDVASSYQPNQPMEEFEEEKFDLCDLTLPHISRAPLVMDSDGSGPEDYSHDGGQPEEGDLVRSDSCSGVVHPSAAAISPWDLEFAYRAIIETPEGEKDEVAEEEASEWFEDVSEESGQDWERGEESFLEEARYLYERTPQSSEYRVVARERSVIIEITMSSDWDNSKSDYADELAKIEKDLALDIGALIPE